MRPTDKSQNCEVRLLDGETARTQDAPEDDRISLIPSISSGAAIAVPAGGRLAASPRSLGTREMKTRPDNSTADLRGVIG